LRKRDSVDAVTALKGAINALQLPIQAEGALAEEKDKKDVFAIKHTSGTTQEPEARLVYIQNDEGELSLTWRMETDILSNWLLSYVDAISGERIHAVVDYSADATYEVYPWGINDPTEGERVVLEDPWNPVASEFGWHSTGDESYTVTRGNNGTSAVFQN
jgi:extracellular elastinolytic metalloproteinase